jgi:hypothetical protein
VREQAPQVDVTPFADGAELTALPARGHSTAI